MLENFQIDRVDTVWSCETVARSRDMEEDSIWPQRLLTKKQEKEEEKEDVVYVAIHVSSTAKTDERSVVHSA